MEKHINHRGYLYIPIEYAEKIAKLSEKLRKKGIDNLTKILYNNNKKGGK